MDALDLSKLSTSSLSFKKPSLCLCNHCVGPSFTESGLVVITTIFSDSQPSFLFTNVALTFASPISSVTTRTFGRVDYVEKNSFQEMENPKTTLCFNTKTLVKLKILKDPLKKSNGDNGQA
ncbi:Ig-like domain-containing protein [Sesbania bispinosa]|nr:Ig-like domain-containing protein [Sesbania bispinosa]